MKIAVIGGGSTYTPELIEGFGLRRECCRSTSWCCTTSTRTGWTWSAGWPSGSCDKLAFPGTADADDRPRAGDRGGVVRARAAPGGRARRPAPRRDDPARFGCIGQETTGAGGFAKALRTVPVVLEIAEDTARLGAPGAWLLDFTNPAGLVTQALIDDGHRAIGLCNIPIGFQRDFARQLGVEPERVQLEHVGLNHLSLGAGGAGGRRGPAARPDPRPTPTSSARRSTCRGRWSALLGAMPSYYLRYFYLPAELRAESGWSSRGRQEVMEIERDLLEMYARPVAGREAEAARAARRSFLLRGGGDARRVAVRRRAATCRW